MLLPADDYHRSAKAVPCADFAKKYPEAVFLLEPFGQLADAGFQTLVGLNATRTRYQVAPIKKRPGANPFDYMITLGRAANNDVIIQGTGVSKFHAYVSHDAQGNPLISDAGSTNGTFVQGKQLKPREERIRLNPGDKVALGQSVNMTFFTAEALYEYLRAKPSL